MAIAQASTFISIRADDSRLRGDFASSERLATTSANRIGSKMKSKFGSIARGIGRAMTTGLVIAGAALAAFVAKSVTVASDIGESLNKANVIFGKSAKGIQKWSATLADTAGISKDAALAATGNFGNMLDAAGLAGEENVKMSKSLVQLSGDLGSFNNIDPTEAADKLRAGLAGEAEGLRTLGVFLSEDAVKREAYSKGIAKNGEELTEAQKIQARYSLIMKQSEKAQGDFVRTSDSLPNTQRRISASFSNLSATVGKVLLPIVTKAANAISDFVNSPEFKKWLKDAAEWIRDFAESAGEWWKRNGDDVKAWLGRIGGFFTEIGELVEWLSVELADAARDLSNLWTKLQQIWGNTVAFVIRLVGKLVKFFLDGFGILVDTVVQFADGMAFASSRKGESWGSESEGFVR